MDTVGSRGVSAPARAMASGGSGWLAEAWALLLKDLRAELRTKVALSTVGLFTFSSLLLLSLATATLKEKLALDPLTNQMRPAWDAAGKMGLLWLLLCFAAFSGLSHAFVHEEETGTVMALRLSMSAGAVYAGKLAFNLLILFAVALVVTPVFMLITGMPLGAPIVFLIVMVSGCVGLAGAATIVGALAAKARGSGALYPAIGLPLLVVFLLLLLNAANTTFIVHPPALRLVRDIGGLLSYGILLITVSALTFSFVWED
ncbi:MAG TPA: ABC transporter permease [Chthonomonadaceae bacterium]|nr:ABC transporter permease [Chthonomonadaceae bacterium]